MTTAESLKARIAVLRKTIRRHKKELNRVQEELVALALKALPPERRPAHPAMGTWKCGPDPDWKGNPDDEDADPMIVNVAVYCIFDTDEDPCHDFCLFCGGPEERQ